MAIKCGWASIDERGKGRGGKAGDQTGREVKIGDWHNFGQNVVIRFKDRAKAKKAASICKQICRNDKVGYDMDNRTTLFTEAKAKNWDITKIKKKVETDCSAMQAVICNAVGIPVSEDWYTGNMVEIAKKFPEEFEILRGEKYTDNDKFLKVGDMLVNTKKHTIMALENGQWASKKQTKKGIKSVATLAREVINGQWGNGETRVKKLKAAGYDPEAVQKKVNEMLR